MWELARSPEVGKPQAGCATGAQVSRPRRSHLPIHQAQSVARILLGPPSAKGVARKRRGMSERSAYRHNTSLSLTITFLFVILSALQSVACTNATAFSDSWTLWIGNPVERGISVEALPDTRSVAGSQHAAWTLRSIHTNSAHDSSLANRDGMSSARSAFVATYDQGLGRRALRMTR